MIPKNKTNDIKIVNISTLEKVVDYLMRDYKSKKEKLELIRGDGNERCYRLINPKLKIKGNKIDELEFIPDCNADIISANYFYINFPYYSDSKMGICIKTSDYNIKKYGNLVQPLHMHVVNKITFYFKYAEWEKSLTSMPKMTIPVIFNGVKCYRNRSAKSTTKETHYYYSHTPNKKKQYIQVLPSLSAFALLPEVFSDPMEIEKDKDIRRGLQHIPRGKKSIEFPFDEHSRSFKRILPTLLSSIYYTLSTFIPRSTNLDLFEFLINEEIPELCSLYWAYEILKNNYPDSSERIVNHNIDFFNRLTVIRKIRGTNAINLMLHFTLLYLPYILVADSKLEECQRCHKFFKYKRGKKYCSYACRKAAESKRYYKKHREKVLPYNKKEMRKTREFIKELISQDKN